MKERLKELYQNGLNGISPSITENGVLRAVSNGWISTDDAIEIIGAEDPVDVVRTAKLKELSAMCNQIIVSGIDLELEQGAVHFNLSIEDQSNINNLFRVVELGGTEFPYQSDGGVCRIYSAAEIVQIYIAAQTLITAQTTYHNELKLYVQSLTDASDIASVTYGMDLPEPYASEMQSKLEVAQEQMGAILAKMGG